MCSPPTLGPNLLAIDWLRSLRSGPVPLFSPNLSQLLCAEPKYSASPKPGSVTPVSWMVEFFTTLSELAVRRWMPSRSLRDTSTPSMTLWLAESKTMPLAELVTAKPTSFQ